MPKSTTKNSVKSLTLQQRRDFIRLPLAQRRRQMAEQAERMRKHYLTGREAAQRESWQGGDIVEP